MTLGTYTYNPGCYCKWCANNGNQPPQQGETGHSWCYEEPHIPPTIRIVTHQPQPSR